MLRNYSVPTGFVIEPKIKPWSCCIYWNVFIKLPIVTLTAGSPSGRAGARSATERVQGYDLSQIQRSLQSIAFGRKELDALKASAFCFAIAPLYPFHRFAVPLSQRERLLYSLRSATDASGIGLVTATAPWGCKSDHPVIWRDGRVEERGVEDRVRDGGGVCYTIGEIAPGFCVREVCECGCSCFVVRSNEDD